MGLLRELHGSVQVVRIGQSQGGVAALPRTLEQRLRTRDAFQKGVPTMHVQRHGHSFTRQKCEARRETPRTVYVLQYTIRADLGK
jgi:hypothetical protein